MLPFLWGAPLGAPPVARPALAAHLPEPWLWGCRRAEEGLPAAVLPEEAHGEAGGAVSRRYPAAQAPRQVLRFQRPAAREGAGQAQGGRAGGAAAGGRRGGIRGVRCRSRRRRHLPPLPPASAVCSRGCCCSAAATAAARGCATPGRRRPANRLSRLPSRVLSLPACPPRCLLPQGGGRGGGPGACGPFGAAAAARGAASTAAQAEVAPVRGPRAADGVGGVSGSGSAGRRLRAPAAGRFAGRRRRPRPRCALGSGPASASGRVCV